MPQSINESTSSIAKRIAAEDNRSTPFQISELLHQLKDHHSDVTAFMTFFSHWVIRRFRRIEIEGLDRIPQHRHHIFISNHRDILLDPVLINHALLSHQLTAARSVIGSNLMEDPAMARLMSLAGCLEVPRGDMPLRDKFKALKQLSADIQSSLEQHNIWIAQREGRAKDGIDETNPAVLKMLLMAKEKHQSTASFLSQQSIIPVSISYQWDPSDTHKALERYIKGLDGTELDNASRTDTMQHLIDSLDRCEGDVQINFGTPLNAETPDELVTHIDQHILENYKYFDSHLAALSITKHEALSDNLKDAENQFKERISELPDAAGALLIESYANSCRK